MRSRTEALTFLKQFKAMSETMHSVKIVFLRVDNAPEYIEGEMRSFCEEQGIQYERTVAEAPSQNGKSERHNYTYERMARAMLMDGDLHIFFWPFMILATVHIKNRVPHSALPRHTTPHEPWHGRKLSLAHLRPFGAHCTSRIVNPALNKFEVWGETGHLVGYTPESKGYLFWHPASCSVKIRRDLRFHDGPMRPLGQGGVDYSIYAPLWDSPDSLEMWDTTTEHNSMLPNPSSNPM